MPEIEHQRLIRLTHLPVFHVVTGPEAIKEFINKEGPVTFFISSFKGEKPAYPSDMTRDMLFGGQLSSNEKLLKLRKNLFGHMRPLRTLFDILRNT